MRHAVEVLERFGVPHERHIVSAHRTPVWMAEFAIGAEARGIEVIIAGAGGAAHLPGMVAAHTLVPVLGVPVQSAALQGLDSLLSIAQMPGGVPVGTLAIGKAGATNAGLLAVSILSNSRPDLRAKLRAFRDGADREGPPGTAAVTPRRFRAGRRRSACSAAVSLDACSPSPRGAWDTASTPSRRRRLANRPGGRPRGHRVVRGPRRAARVRARRRRRHVRVRERPDRGD